MPFQVSPGVNVSEIDLTTVVPAVSSTEGAIAGVFRWGPVDKRVLVDSEDNLVARFGKPTNLNAETFFTGANFLSYGNKLYVVRTANTTTANGEESAISAVANTDTVTDQYTFTIKNDDAFESFTIPGGETDVKYIARYPGALGNSLKVSVCDSESAYRSTDVIGAAAGLDPSVGVSFISANIGSSTHTVTVGLDDGVIADAVARATALAAKIIVGDKIELGNNTLGKQLLAVSSVGTVSNTASIAQFTITTTGALQLASNITQANMTRQWEYAEVVDAAPGVSAYQTSFGNAAATDELHIVVADEGGAFSGVPGSVLEVYRGVSRASDAKTEDGASNFYKTVINNSSRYIYTATDRTGAGAGLAASLIDPTTTAPLSLSFQGGADGANESTVPLTTLLAGYGLFTSAEDVDISLVLTGQSITDATKANWLINNIAEVRKDCVVFVSPRKADVVNNGAQDEVDDVIAFRNLMGSTSYAVMDSGYKYQYDKYNDIYRWIPLNGDTAGLCVRTDQLRDAWWSPAGFNRGQIKNIVKLAFNPKLAARDQLYKAGVNPIVTFPGQGTILYGDKTLLAKPSAFDRINVRRLFIVLEKAIATAAKYTLFEFNDDFTRAQFRNLVEPFLRDVQGRRGIYDFRVICDTTNNTGEVIDRNEFIGDIYIKPAKSINFIQLNFVAVRTGVEFSEVVGQF
jgi:hypothetical protein